MEAYNRFQEQYGEYLKDESRQTGTAMDIVFPKTEDEIIEVIKKSRSEKVEITTQGARTGLAASAVPRGGRILNLSRMNKVIGARYDKESDRFFIKVQPGLLLSELRKYLKNKSFIIKGWDEDSIKALEQTKTVEWFYSTDPTETSASIGGIIACNASGAKSFRYGSARNHTESIRIVLSDGDVLSLKRGQNYANDGYFNLVTESGKNIQGILPKYEMPHVMKNTSGYYNNPSMDMVDLFIGSDGTLGIISEIELELNKTQSSNWGITVFMPDEDSALDLVRAVRGENIEGYTYNFKTRASAIEFFSHNALKMLRQEQKRNPCFASIQKIKNEYHTAIYIEIENDTDEESWSFVEELGNLVNILGGSEDNTWVANNSVNLDKLHSFRHACPECVNMKIDIARKVDSRITKLGTDMSVPDAKLKDVMKMYNEDLISEGLDYVIFGHVGSNHLHVNTIPKNMDEYNKAKEIYSIWAEKISLMGGAVSAEHGVGKLKVSYLEKMYGEEVLDQMRNLKKLFDPEQMLNRGTIFPYKE